MRRRRGLVLSVADLDPLSGIQRTVAAGVTKAEQDGVLARDGSRPSEFFEW